MNDEIKDILKKGKSGNAPEIDRQKILSLFHQPEKEYQLKDILLEEAQTTQADNNPPTDFKKLFDRLWKHIEQKPEKSKSRLLKPFLRIAAAIAIGLFIGIYVSSIQSVPTEPVYYAAHSPKGSVSEMLLPDGSVIYLNADSKIKYSIDGKDGIREVFLTGEAWFDVQKNTDKPFVVHTPFYDVNVTGTQFNVKAYETDNQVVTTLEEGQVIIQSTENYKHAEDVTLKPGEQLTLDKQLKKIDIKTVNTNWYTSWKDNKLIFVNMNLKDLVVLLERKYGVDIEVKNKEILDLHFDGTIKNESIIEILEILKKALPVNYKIVGQKIEITDSKNLSK